MRRTLCALLTAATFVAVTVIATPVFAQSGATSSISGTVVDSGGGVIPGATVVVKNNASGTTFNAVTNSAGTFSVPALDAGTYTVTVSLSGFKTALVKDVVLAVGTPGSIKAVLEVGGIEQTVEVVATTQLINTQTPTIASTLTSEQINKLPVATRNLVNAVTFLPGVNTAGVNRDSNFNGLPDSFVAISLDGVNNNENFNKSTEGLFAMVTPRPDAVEAVTVTTAGAGADVGGHGAVQIAFQTRSGTNRFTGSAYHYHRSPGMNTNFFFNEINDLPKNDVVLNQFGFRQGGPIVIPKLYDGRGKAFFFFNYEELRLPNDFTRTRTVIQPQAQAGVFSWDATENGQTVIRTRDVLALAGANGHINSYDPDVLRILNDIHAATQSQGVITPTNDLNTTSYLWLSPGKQHEKQPVVKLDYNLTSQHRISGTYNWQVVVRDPDHLNNADVRFPGFVNYRKYTVLPAAQLRDAALDAVAQRGQRAARRHQVGAVVFRGRRQQRAAHVRPAGRVQPRVPAQPHQCRQPEHADSAERLELEHRQHVELAARHPQPQLRHVAVLRQRVGRQPADGAEHRVRRGHE